MNIMEKCFQNCSKGYYTYNNITYCKCERDKCYNCTPVAIALDLCNKCNDNYYPKENDDLNYGEYIECYNEINGYYVDKTNSIFKKCFHTCETCDKGGNAENHNCILCNNNFPFGIKMNNYFNCYFNCSFYYYFDVGNNYHCTENQSCPIEYPRLLANRLECIKNDINYLMQNIAEIEKNETQNENQNEEQKEEQKKEEIKYYDTIMNKSEEIFTSDYYDTLNIDKGEKEVINAGKVTIVFKTTQDSKNDTNDNLTSIDLGECETLLRNYYNISKNEFIYLKQTEVEQEGIQIKKVECNVYAKLSNSNLIKLNLSVCKDTKMILSVPIKISESLDKLNISSGYYNDICYVTTSDSGTDITLEDRKKEYMKRKNIICQEGCDFSNYDYNTQRANCSCDVKESSSSFANMNINTTKLYEKFIDLNNILNFQFMVCYNILFSKNGIIHNIAFYALIILIIFHLLTIIIFYKNKIFIIKDKIKGISFGINNWNLVIEYDKEIIRLKKEKEKEKEKLKMKKIIIAKNKKIKANKEEIIKIPTALDYYFLDKLINKKNPPNKRNISLKININNDQIKNKSSNAFLATEALNKKDIVMKAKNIMAYNDEEMNNLAYKLALKFDKRSYCEYYLSLIKTKHILIFSFYNNMNNYNSQIIKIDLFFVGFINNFFVNALFFNDDTMHKILEDEGTFDFVYQLPKIIYSTLISTVLNTLLKILALSEGNILNFKKNKNTKDLNKRQEDLNHLLKIKFILYFIISTIFIIFFWYYLSMFCAIYRNTQLHLIKDTLLSFGLSLLYPFGIYLLPGIFRIPALSNRKSKESYVYNFSVILQMI